MNLTTGDLRMRRTARYASLLKQRFEARHGDPRNVYSRQAKLDILRGLAFELLGEQDESLDIASLMAPMDDAIQEALRGV